MAPEAATIPARSRHQAMDWSLVLASQGIENSIEFTEEDGAWGLKVAPGDLQAALTAIHLYQIENRRWPWRKEVLQPGLLFDWGSLAWVLLLGLFFWLRDGPLDLRAAGAMDSVLVSHGQWWRLFTAIWLHADLGHFGSNATLGFVLLGLAMGRFGTGAGLLAAYLAGAGGNLLVWLLAVEPHYNLGASGMVMGSLGLLAVQSFALWRQTPHGLKYLFSGIFAGIMLFILFGVSPGTDVLAHLGGFLSGLALGAVCALIPNLHRRVMLNLCCGFVFASLVVAPWYFALRGR